MKDQKKNHKAAPARRCACRVWNVFSVIFMTGLIAAEGLTLFQVWNLQMLPMKYFGILAGIVVLIDIPLLIAMFPQQGKWQKKTGTGKRIFSYFLALVIAGGCYLGFHATNKLDETFDAITKVPTISAHVGVYVTSENSAAAIEDAAQYVFAVTRAYDAENSDKAVEGIEELLGNTIETRVYDSVLEMIDALYAGETQAMILNTAYPEILAEIEGYADFSEKTRMLYQYDVIRMEQPSEPENQDGNGTSHAESDRPTETPFVIYLSGSDTRSSMLAASRSDVNILAAIHPVTKQILLINTPRDYFIPNPAYGGALDKLTHCGLDGMENSMKALSDLYGQTVSYSAQINFTGFETLIDAVGGISIYSDVDDGVYLREGENYMDGAQALEFARDRYSYAAGDNARGVHQMQVIKAVVDKLTSSSVITGYSDIMDSLQGMFATDMSSDLISQFIKMQLNDMASWNIQSYAVTGTGGSDTPAAMGGGIYAYVMYPDENMVSRASQLIDRVMDGDILTSADVAMEEN